MYGKVICLALAVALGGCATNPISGPTIGGIPATPVVSTTTPAAQSGLNSTTVGDIQNAVASACGFVPTVQTVQGIAASFFSGGELVNSIVSGVENAICNAVVVKKTASRHGLRAASGPPMVRGVRVQGYFLR